MVINSVLNYSYLLRIIKNRFRGRVFATIDTFTWTMMMVSMMAAGIASTHFNPRLIGTVAGLLSSTTALFWGWANWTSRLPLPDFETEAQQELEVFPDHTIGTLPPVGRVLWLRV